MVGGDDLQERGDRRSQLRLGVGVLLAFDLYGTQRGAVVRRPPVIQSLRSDLGLQRLVSELLRLDQVMLRPPHFRERIEDVRNGIYSAEFARETFGVALTDGGSAIDPEATASLRETAATPS